jgi:hypothetical protein
MHAPLLSGFGNFYYPNGAQYSGEWKLLIKDVPPPVEDKKAAKPKKDDPPLPPTEPPKRVRHGKGTYTEGKFVYTGDFVEDTITGTGRFSYPSEAKYQGQWVNGAYEGQGTYSWPDGRSYTGSWVANKMHGHGVFTDASGQKWEGTFHQGSGPGLTNDLQ